MTDFADTAALLACLAVGVKLTDDTMRANLSALPIYHRDVDGPVKHAGQAGAKYVRVDAAFALDFAGPLVLQGAVTTCYCFFLYVLASVMITVAAYAFVLVKSAALSAIAMNADPLKALDAIAVKDGQDKRTKFLENALRTVFSNTMASTGLLFRVAVAQAAVSAAVLAALAVFALALRPRWTFVHKGRLYADVRFLAQASTATTMSALPFVCALLFSRTDAWARWKAAVWRYLQ